MKERRMSTPSRERVKYTAALVICIGGPFVALILMLGFWYALLACVGGGLFVAGLTWLGLKLTTRDQGLSDTIPPNKTAAS
jgi:hypothetical protein